MKRLFSTTVCVSAVIVLFAPAIALSQTQYRSVAPGAWVNDKTQFNRIRFDVPSIIRGNLDFRSNQDKLNQYFNQYMFPLMTRFDDESLNELPELRQEFLATLQRQPSINQEAHDYVVALTMATMEKIATGDFHPAVRYNAMLIIGEMNTREAQLVGAQRAPPVPLKDALAILLREIANPDQLDAVRVAALLGVHRHARIERENSKLNRTQFNDADIRQLISAMLDIVQQEPPANRTEEGHAWMQRRAIEVLAEIGTVDAGGSVAKEIEKVVEDKDAPISLRLTAARAMGQLSFTTVQNFDAAAIATELGRLAILCCRNEIDRVAQLKKEKEERELREQLAQVGGRLGGGPGARPRGEGVGIRPGGIGDPFGLGGGGLLEEQEPEWQMINSKRRLKFQLGSIRTALSGTPAPLSRGQTPPKTGLLQRASGNQQQEVAEIIAGVDNILSALDAEVFTRDDLLARVARNMTALGDRVGADSGTGLEVGPAGVPGGGFSENPAAPGSATPVPGGAAPGTPVPGGPAPGAPNPGAPVPGGPAPGGPVPGNPVPGAPAPGV